jgi:hypothetical protein
VDSLDTLWLMELMEEYSEARNWVVNDMQLNKNVTVSVFESTIRILGGLMSAFELSNDREILAKATQLGNILLGAFDEQYALPWSHINLLTYVT